MAKRAIVDIALGDETYVIRPLTIDQVEAVEEAIGASYKTKSAQAREIIKIGLSRDHSAVDLTDVEATMAELAEAMSAILRQGGFLPPGEAKAAADASAGSMSEVG